MLEGLPQATGTMQGYWGSSSAFWSDWQGRQFRKFGNGPDEICVRGPETDETWALSRLRWIYGCGCGRPEESYELIRDVLRTMPLHSDGGYDECLALFGGNLGAMQIVLHRMTDADLITHGGGIGGSWLEPEGERMLAIVGDVDDFDEWLETAGEESWVWREVKPAPDPAPHDAPLETLEDALAYVKRYSYKSGGRLNIVEDPERPRLLLSFTLILPDSRIESDQGGIPIGRTVPLEFRPPFNASYLRALIVEGWQNLELHEVGEWIRFDGELLVDPHSESSRSVMSKSVVAG